eukprot:4799350-Pyramimonas_sp.AAC.1
MGRGKAHQWGLPDTINDHMKEMIRMFIGRGFPVLPADQRINGTELGTVDAAVYACRYSQEPECGSAFAANAAVPVPPPADSARQRMPGPCPDAGDA